LKCFHSIDYLVLVALSICFVIMLFIWVTTASLNGECTNITPVGIWYITLPFQNHIFSFTVRPTSLVEAFLKIYSRVRPHLSFPALFSWVQRWECNNNLRLCVYNDTTT
jgi:hypothetical protein